MCVAEGFGLEVDEIDILVGGREHDLLDSSAQEAIMARIAAGDYDIVIMSPPCATWSRARHSGKPGPDPVRNKDHPWGIPHLKFEWMKKAADTGNTFIHFAIRTITTCQSCKRRGFRVMTLVEHPEDLGRSQTGIPASIWQLKELRVAYAEFPFVSVAGHQCQFDLDAAKPTRLFSDIVSLVAFGYGGWPRFDESSRYLGPLPRHCGHNHNLQTIGQLPGGGHATAPLACYPDKMCSFIAFHIFEDWKTNGSGSRTLPGGKVMSSSSSQGTTSATTSGGSRRKKTFPSSRNSLNGPEGSTAEDPREEDESFSDIPIKHLFRPNELFTAEEIDEATEAMDDRGINRPLMEGIEGDDMPRLACDSSDLSLIHI